MEYVYSVSADAAGLVVWESGYADASKKEKTKFGRGKAMVPTRIYYGTDSRTLKQGIHLTQLICCSYSMQSNGLLHQRWEP